MIVIVLGMHRSGTSALAGMLHDNGIVMGEHGDFHPPPMRENPKGFFENRRFRTVNDQVVRTNGYKVKSFNPGIPPMKQVGVNGWEQMGHLIKYYNDKYKAWGFKDPRTCLTLHHWLRAIRHAGHEAHVLYITRDYMEVAQSMRNRGNKEKLGPNQFFSLAAMYNDIATKTLVGMDQPFLHVNFDQLIYETEYEATRISKYLGHEIKDTSFIEPHIVRSGNQQQAMEARG